MVAVVGGGWWLLQRPTVQAMLLASTPPPLMLQDEAPAFPPEVQALGGSGLPVPLHVTGRPAVVNLFATWCPPCVAEIPSLMRLRSTASEHADVHIVSSEPLDAVHAWADRRGFDQAAFLHLDAERITGVLATRSIPVTWIISGDGRLVQRIHGAHAWDDPSVVAFLASLSVDPTERVSSSVAQGP